MTGAASPVPGGTPRPPGRVAIAGAGSIGIAFAIRFAMAGSDVRVWDPFPSALERGRGELEDRLELLDGHGLLADSQESTAARVELVDDLARATDGAALLQECVPEQLDLKRQLLTDAGQLLPEAAVLASASSAIAPSNLAETLAPDLAQRLIVGHPANPPYLLPVIELVPSPQTRTDVVERARQIYTAAGMRPVVVHHEPEGFVFNRLQGALLREAYCLVRDGVATVEDIDEVVRSGLGRRWSLMGPFETADLNTRGGLESHAEKMGPAYERMGAERGQRDPWTVDLIATVVAQRRQVLPLEAWPQRVRWRDEQLLRLTPAWDRARSQASANTPDDGVAAAL